MSQPLAIVDAIKECYQVFQDASSIPSLEHREWVENRLADFNLWCAGVNASGSGKSSLQARLATSLEAQTFFIQLLSFLTALLKKCIELAIPHPDLSRTTDSRLSQTMHDVQDTLGQLARVTVAIRNAGIRSRMQKADASFNYDDPQIQALRQHLEILLLARPSEIGTLQARVSSQEVTLYASTHRSVEVGSESLDNIAKRLIEANLRRLNRFLYAQRHAEKLSNTMLVRNSSSQVTTETTMTPRSPVRSIPTDGQELKKHSSHVESATTATVIQDTIILPAQPAHYPTTTMISATASRVEYPKPPSVNIDQVIFQCPCCCQMLPVSVSSGARWKKHIAKDVLPYTCILDDCPCPEKTYETMETWKSHMFADHRGIPHWTCFACTSSEQHPSFDRKDKFITHLERQHGKGITSQQIPILLSAWLRTSPVLIRSCPLCSYSHENAEAALSHTAEHIHSFSLLSLPWASTKEEDLDIHGDYFKHHKYFNMDQSTHGSLQASFSAGSQELDSDLSSIDFEPSTEPTQLTKEKLGLLSQNSGSGPDTALWLDLILDESEDLDSSMFLHLEDSSIFLEALPGPDSSSQNALGFPEDFAGIGGLWLSREQGGDQDPLNISSQNTPSFTWDNSWDWLDKNRDESKDPSPSTAKGC